MASTSTLCKPLVQGMVVLLALHLSSPWPEEFHSLILQSLSSDLEVDSEKHKERTGVLYSCPLFLYWLRLAVKERKKLQCPNGTEICLPTE